MLSERLGAKAALILDWTVWRRAANFISPSLIVIKGCFCTLYHSCHTSEVLLVRAKSKLLLPYDDPPGVQCVGRACLQPKNRYGMHVVQPPGLVFAVNLMSAAEGGNTK
jgi:hypothetical protein